MGKTLIYQKHDLGMPAAGLLGAASYLAARMLNIQFSVDDLVNGKHIECKDIVEMRAVEEQIKEACSNFKALLETATHFGGEEVFEI